MNLHVFQHEPFEGPALIGDWARERGHAMSFTRLYEPHRPPDLGAADWLVVMGGGMGAYDEGEFPWLKDEKRWIEQAIRKEKTVIGVCLGSQLIAEVLGARVYKNKEKEIGWLPVRLTPSGRRHPLFDFLPREFTPFHWHGDTFDLPAGATHLASSAATANQAFGYGKNVLALQFHLESTRESVEGLIAHCGNELVSGRHIQTAEKIGELSDKHLPFLKEATYEIMGRL